MTCSAASCLRRVSRRSPGCSTWRQQQQQQHSVQLAQRLSIQTSHVYLKSLSLSLPPKPESVAMAETWDSLQLARLPAVAQRVRSMVEQLRKLDDTEIFFRAVDEPFAARYHADISSCCGANCYAFNGAPDADDLDAAFSNNVRDLERVLQGYLKQLAQVLKTQGYLRDNDVREMRRIAERLWLGKLATQKMCHFDTRLEIYECVERLFAQHTPGSFRAFIYAQPTSFLRDIKNVMNVLGSKYHIDVICETAWLRFCELKKEMRAISGRQLQPNMEPKASDTKKSARHRPRGQDGKDASSGSSTSTAESGPVSLIQADQGAEAPTRHKVIGDSDTDTDHEMADSSSNTTTTSGRDDAVRGAPSGCGVDCTHKHCGARQTYLRGTQRRLAFHGAWKTKQRGAEVLLKAQDSRRVFWRRMSARVGHTSKAQRFAIIDEANDVSGRAQSTARVWACCGGTRQSGTRCSSTSASTTRYWPCAPRARRRCSARVCGDLLHAARLVVDHGSVMCLAAYGTRVAPFVYRASRWPGRCATAA